MYVNSLPDNLYFRGTLHLFLLPLMVVPVKIKEEHDQGRHLLALLVQPVHLQDASRLVVFVVGLRVLVNGGCGQWVWSSIDYRFVYFRVLGS